MANNIEQHKNILDSIHKTYIAKNNDYGNSFSKSFEKYGITCAMVRMEDKWNRLESLVSGKKQMVSDESIKDTLLDLANYAIMTYMELENQDFDKQAKEMLISQNRCVNIDKFGDISYQKSQVITEIE